MCYLTGPSSHSLTYSSSFRYYSRPPLNFYSPNDAAAGPTVTIIRPVKGVEPYLYECLASTFHQQYFTHKLLIRFCVSSRDDPAFPILEQLVKDYGNKYNVQILVEKEDGYLQSPEGRQQVGPNPKIRNMSRAYREADRDHGGVVWIIDCNVWVESYTLYKMLGLRRQVQVRASTSDDRRSWRYESRQGRVVFTGYSNGRDVYVHRTPEVLSGY